MSSDPQRKTGEPKTGTHFVWYLVALALILITGFYLVWNQRIHRISWTDLNHLVEKMATASQVGTGTVPSIDPSRGQPVESSRLRVS